MDDQNKNIQPTDQSTNLGFVPPVQTVTASQPIEDITPVTETPAAPATITEAPKTTFTTTVSTPTPEPQFVSPLVSSQPDTTTTFTTTVSTPVSTPEPSYVSPLLTPIDSTVPETPSLPTPPTEPESEIPREKPKSKILPIVGGVLALLLVLGGAGAAYFVSNQLSTRQAVAPNAPTSKPAATEPTPNPLLGNGRDGVCNVSTGSAILNSGSCSGKTTADAVSFSSTANTLVGATSIILLSQPTGLSVGDEVLIINLQGTSSDYANVGKFEFRKIASISGNTLNFTSPLDNAYNGSTQKILVQRVPNYTNVTVASGATLTANAWDGTKGGVLALRVNGTLEVNGTVSMTGKGYRGHAGGKGLGGESFCGYNSGSEGAAGSCGGGAGGYGSGTYQDPYSGGSGGAGGSTGGAGGGGGGSNGSGPGGGGGGGYGSFGIGGKGGRGGEGKTGGTGASGGTGISGKGGQAGFDFGWEGHTDQATPLGGGGGGGGTYGDSNLTKLYFGSAGGQGGSSTATANGIGGAGGGILVIYANNLTLTGTIQSNGVNGANTAGGAGAGGSLYIASNSQSAAASLITAAGGVGGGGSPSTGGAGGSGILVNISTPEPTISITITVTEPPITGTENSCTLINVYKKVDGAYGTTALTATELKSLKAGDILKFSLISDTDNLQGRFRVTIGSTAGEWLTGTIDTTNKKLVTYSDYTVTTTGTYKFEAQVSTTP